MCEQMVIDIPTVSLADVSIENIAFGTDGVDFIISVSGAAHEAIAVLRLVNNEGFHTKQNAACYDWWPEGVSMPQATGTAIKQVDLDHLQTADNLNQHGWVGRGSGDPNKFVAGEDDDVTLVTATDASLLMNGKDTPVIHTFSSRPYFLFQNGVENEQQRAIAICSPFTYDSNACPTCSVDNNECVMTCTCSVPSSLETVTSTGDIQDCESFGVGADGALSCEAARTLPSSALSKHLSKRYFCGATMIHDYAQYIEAIEERGMNCGIVYKTPEVCQEWEYFRHNDPSHRGRIQCKQRGDLTTSDHISYLRHTEGNRQPTGKNKPADWFHIEGNPATPAPTAPTPGPTQHVATAPQAWWIVHGTGCEVDEDDFACVHDGEDNYGNGEHCNFTLAVDATVTSDHFHLEMRHPGNDACDWDAVQVGGDRYCGDSVPGYHEKVFEAGTAFTFFSDPTSRTYAGFKLCASYAGCQLPENRPGASIDLSEMLGGVDGLTEVTHDTVVTWTQEPGWRCTGLQYICSDGVLVSPQCRDIDECEENSPCDDSLVCTNTPGSYSCDVSAAPTHKPTAGPTPETSVPTTYPTPEPTPSPTALCAVSGNQILQVVGESCDSQDKECGACGCAIARHRQLDGTEVEIFTFKSDTTETSSSIASASVDVLQERGWGLSIHDPTDIFSNVEVEFYSYFPKGTADNPKGLNALITRLKQLADDQTNQVVVLSSVDEPFEHFGFGCNQISTAPSLQLSVHQHQAFSQIAHTTNPQLSCGAQIKAEVERLHMTSMPFQPRPYKLYENQDHPDRATYRGAYAGVGYSGTSCRYCGGKYSRVVTDDTDGTKNQLRATYTADITCPVTPAPSPPTYVPTPAPTVTNYTYAPTPAPTLPPTPTRWPTGVPTSMPTVYVETDAPTPAPSTFSPTLSPTKSPTACYGSDLTWAPRYGPCRSYYEPEKAATSYANVGEERMTPCGCQQKCMDDPQCQYFEIPVGPMTSDSTSCKLFRRWGDYATTRAADLTPQKDVTYTAMCYSAEAETDSPTPGPTPSPTLYPTPLVPTPTMEPTPAPTRGHQCDSGSHNCDTMHGVCIPEDDYVGSGKAIQEGLMVMYYCDCDHGYEFVHDEDPTNNECTPKVCPEFEAPADATVDYGHVYGGIDRQHGSVATIYCNSGYYDTYTGDSITYRTCDNGEFDGKNPECVIHTCPDVSLDNGGITFSDADRKHGSYLTAACNAGYYLEGSNYRTCMSGAWDGTATQCLPARCQELEVEYAYSMTYTDSDNFGSVATVTCEDGSEVTTNCLQTSAGSEEGHWDNQAITCGRATGQCPTIDVDYGVASYSDGLNHNSVAHITCDDTITEFDVTCSLTKAGSDSADWSKVPECPTV